jgi:DNA polymerase-1
MKTELCKSCPYYSCNPVSPKKIENADLMVIGEAPQGWEEEPVSGAAGKYARRIIKEVFGEGSKIVYTTACLCRPNSQDLNAQALSLCSSQFLFKFIEECNPKAILCLGSIAKKIFSEGVVSDVSDVLSSWGGRILGTASHPAVVLRNPAMEADFRRIVRQIYNTVNPKHLKKELFTVYDIGALDKAMEDISSWEGFVGSDIEATGLDVLAPDSAVTHISFGQGSRAYSLYFLKEVDPIFKVRAWQFVKQQYARKNVKHAFHHGVFDTQYLRYHGVEVGPYVDTEVMMFLLNENRIINNLKDLSAEYVGNYEYSIDNKDFIKYGMYSAEDSFMVINLFEQLNKYMTPALWRVMADLIIPFIRLVQEMMLTGLKVNKEQARSVSRSLREEKIKLYADFLEKFKMFRGINIASSDQLVRVLQSQGVPLGKRTKSKESYSVDYEVLQQLSASGYSWADYIIKMREIDKLTSTYVDKLPKTVQADGRIHCEIDVLGTSTGRPSCKAPNLMNIPRNDDIYRMFVADKGKIYVYADCSQQEMRTMASLANERVMIDAYHNNKDLHKMTASMSTGKFIDDITKEVRQIFKSVNFGLLYGSTAEGLKSYLFVNCGLDTTLEEATKFRNDFFSLYPALPVYYKKLEEEVRTTYQVVSPLGRIRRFPKVYYDLNIDTRWRNGGYEIPVDIRNQAYNAPNQSAASDCAVFIMCNMQRLMHKRKLPAKFVLTVYDSFMIEAENNKDVISEITGIAEMATHDILPASPLFQWLKVPLKLEYCVGPSWGDLEEIKV